MKSSKKNFPAPPLSSPIDILRKYWGYDSFRPLQEEIISSVLSGHDTLGLMPTGGGKSITFQVPALLLEGITVVVTPLISLMKDQTDNLRRRRIEAVYFHSAMTRHENTVAWQRITNHRARFIYIAPERLRNERFMAELRHLQISLIVVDEAHCISQWGYDFRPSYLNIKALRKLFPTAPVMALTATATPQVAEDICSQLEFRNPKVFRMSFTRSNISYLVRQPDSKLSEIRHILAHTSGSAIVYVRSRKRTKEIADYLTSCDISATFYHAGLSFADKEERQNLWQSSQIRVMVATNAFGMGIDKPDVRVVIHYDLPPSLEEYYQEAGRAGRDGLTSYAVLLAGPTDKGRLHRNLTDSFPSREDIRRTYERACTFIDLAIGEGYDSLHEFDLDKFCTNFRLQPRFAKACFHLLGQAGYLQFEEEAENKSRIIIKATREELYDLRLKDPTADAVLLQILRTYPGLFADYVLINEDRIARDTNLPTRTVYEALLTLSRTKALHYIPRKRTPMMYVPTAREEARYVSIGKNIYEDRREVMSRRIEAMIDYAYNPSGCRVSRMLAYFGETNAAPCGTCDICRSAKASGRPASPSKDITSRIIELLSDAESGLTISDIERTFGPSAAPSAISILSSLCSQGFTYVEDNLYFLKK